MPLPPPTAAAPSATPAPAAARRRRAARLGLAAAALAALLAGCATGGTAGPADVVVPSSSGPSLPNGTVLDLAVPASTASIPLVDQDGKTVTLGAYAGKTVVLTDFLTQCQEICPLTSAAMSQVSGALAKANRSDVVILETTVDPKRDDVAHLKAYQKLFGATPRWSFLTGTQSDIEALWKQFGVSLEPVPITEKPLPKDWLTGKPLTYDVDHQDVVIVIGPDGHERWLVNGTPSIGTPSDVPSTLQGFLSPQGLQNESAAPEPNWTSSDVLAAVSYVSGTPVS